MKKQIIVGIGIAACVALCAAVWPRSVEVGDLPDEPVKTAVSAGIEARSEQKSQTLISVDMPTPMAEAVTERNPPETEVTTEKETGESAPAQTALSVKQSPTSSEPHNGDVRIVDGEKPIYLLGFGWIKDEGGGSVGTMVGGTIAEDMYESGHKIGIMGGAESAPSNSPSPPAEQSEVTGDVIYTELQPPVTKNSTPPAYKPNGEPYNP